MNKKNQLILQNRFFLLSALFFCSICTSMTLAAQNNQKMIPLESPIYSWLQLLWTETGTVPKDFAFPWSQEEILSGIKELQPKINSASAAKLLEKIQTKLQSPATYSHTSEQNTTDFIFHGSIIASLEGYCHIPLQQDSNCDYAWEYGYDQRKSLLTIPLEVWLGNSLYLTSDLSVKEEYMAITNPYVKENNRTVNYSNMLSFENPALDLYFPFRAFFSLGAENWSFQFGRDKANWGNGITGNLMLSDFSDYYDSLQFRFFIPAFKWTTLYAVLDPFYYNQTTKAFTSQTYAAFLGHRLDFRILPNLLLTVNESVTFGNFLPELVRDLNFLMIFHNWMIPERTNSLLALELTWAVTPAIRLHAQAAMDEFATAYEQARGGGGGPPIFGFLAGIRSLLPVDQGLWSLNAEFAITSPWLYNRRAPPYYFNVRRYWSLVTDNYEYIVKPLGYRYGPDAVVFCLQTQYTPLSSYHLSLETLYIVSGEKGYWTLWDPAPGDSPPSGIAENKLRLNFEGAWDITDWLSLSGNVLWILRMNASHIQGKLQNNLEFAAAVVIKL